MCDYSIQVYCYTRCGPIVVVSVEISSRKNQKNPNWLNKLVGWNSFSKKGSQVVLWPKKDVYCIIMQPNITVTQPKYNLYKYILIRLSRNEGKWFIWHLVKWNIRVYVFMGDWVMDCLIDIHSNERLRKLFCYVRIWRLYECTTNTQNLNGLQCLVPAECWFDVFCVWGLFSDLTNFRRTKIGFSPISSLKIVK